MKGGEAGKPAMELKPGDHIETPRECSGEVLSATHRGGYVYVRIAGRTELCMLEPHAEVSVRAEDALCLFPRNDSDQRRIRSGQEYTPNARRAVGQPAKWPRLSAA